MRKLFFLVAFFLLLTSCAEEKKDALLNTSPNKNIQLSVSGKRENFLSPWNVNLVATGKGLKGNISFDFFASEISDKTVSFVWDKNQTCTITFTQKDNTQRIFLFTPNSTEAMWTDVSLK